MAIYHCSLRIFSRSDGHSAVAAAAYRAGAVLKDQRTGRIHRYGKRKGVLDAFILAPPSTPQRLLDRAVLWNAAEEAETRKNSRVAREVILALPHELSDADRQSLCRDMARWLVERYRVAVDTAIHSPVQGDGHDGRNHHAHLLFTTRELGPEGLGKKTRILDDKEHGPHEVEIIREVWETLANDALARAGVEGVQIDRRTLEDQGIDRVPQTHVGKAANYAEEEEKPAKRQKLKAQFGQAEKQTEKEDKDGEEESEGKAGKTGKGGNGDRALILKSEAKEDRKGRVIDYKAIDQNRTRLDFNEEIKKLNERRNTFGNVPIKEQIAHIEKLTDLLESREKHLKTLLSKATLPYAIKWAIETLITNFKEAVFVREKDRAASKFTSEEKDARTERQFARYSRSYRTGLQEQIVEMKTNLDRLEQRQREYQSLKNFVDKIENEVRQLPKIAFEQSVKSQPVKSITNEEYSLKLNLKAQMIRETVPSEFKPDKQQVTLKSQSDFKIEKDPNAPPLAAPRPSAETFQPKISTSVERPASFNAKSIIDKPLPEKISRPLAVNFQEKAIAVASSQKTETRPTEWKQSMPVRISALEKAIQEKQQPKESPAPRTELSERKNWHTTATEKTQPLQKVIDTEIAKVRKAEKEASPIREQFRNPDPPIPQTTNEIEIEKIRQEAQEMRIRVPPQYRAASYEQSKHETEPEQEINSFKSAFGTKATEKQSGNEDPIQLEATPKPKMSHGFNTASFNGGEPPTPETPTENFSEEKNAYLERTNE